MSGIIRLCALLIAALLTGCSPTVARTLALNSLIGQSDQAVFQRLGTPTQTLDEGGAQIFVYQQGTVQWTPFGKNEIYLPYFGAPSAGRPENVTQRGCQTRFAVQNGIVRSFAFTGHTC